VVQDQVLQSTNFFSHVSLLTYLYFSSYGNDTDEVPIWVQQLTDQNCIHKETDSRLNLQNACYHLVQSLLSSQLLSRNIKVKIYKTIILPLVSYGCETWSLTLREEHRLRVFENMVLWKIFGPMQHELIGEWRKSHRKRLRTLYSSPSTIRTGRDKFQAPGHHGS
jgi:hypothetical protein